jgi:predicted aldo/keto reductase-like oxidoreductase
VKKVRLGKTGLMVSRTGVGGIPIQRPSLDEAIKVMRRALDLGINFIDTARGYGESEERIGKAIAGRRKDVIIATKGGGNREQTLSSIEESLRRLGTDYIDLWQFHGINSFDYFEEILGHGGGMEGARRAKEQGKILHIAFSSHSLEVALKATASGFFEAVQFPLNFVSDEAAAELVTLARKEDAGFIAMKPFAGGHIHDGNLAMTYLMQFDNVVPDPGVEKIHEVEQIVDIVNKGPRALGQEERREIERIRTMLGSKFCHQCGYCMPCPNGVDISMVMIMQPMWRMWPEPLFRDPEWWYCKAVRTGNNCQKCGECEPKCPYKLDIRQMIDESLAFLAKVGG